MRGFAAKIQIVSASLSRHPADHPRYTRARERSARAPRPARPRAGALAARTPERTVTGGDNGERPGSPVGPRLRSRRYALRHRAPGVDPCRQERPRGKRLLRFRLSGDGVVADGDWLKG